MNPVIIVSIIVGVIVLLLLFGTSFKPIRFIGQACIKLVIGALFLFLLNTFGSALSIHIPINTITTVISGFLGIPGVAAMVIIKYVIVS
ncbi:pro-sigmaK processing inhibitor BofA family protein [Pullulanibacillus pueri]|uniref:Sigma-K factor-processing regulatory protein BofA n=1 Tax=Pullulanibacillus pueri TaxID=1437324 RepID=A0A8J3A070_9BACL|nr:pro-sigmaK processing inhibitor BofA family protein [Pullulanibacillus pueri]GGH88793.1 sigma-K factor-processing regulatory protein BofA [Pullulanibacillus pueri]